MSLTRHFELKSHHAHINMQCRRTLRDSGDDVITIARKLLKIDQWCEQAHTKTRVHGGTRQVATSS